MPANIIGMTLHEYGLRSACGIRFLLGSLIFIAAATFINPATWDRKGAQRAFEEARSLRDEIARSSSPTRAKYLQCANKYRLVYVRDPHYTGCDDAIHEQGILYEEMGNKFGILEDYRHAAKLFHFLISDYGGSRFCPDALLRLGDLYNGPLEDRDAAQQAFQQLRMRYKYSKAAASLAAEKTIPKEEPAKPAGLGAIPASSNANGQSATPVSVRDIRYWTTSDYTRVVIDMEGETRYDKTRLSDPDRIYFDISNAKLSHDLLNRVFVVGDQFLKQVRAAQNQMDVVRVVLDFAQVSDYSVFELHDPFRIIIDIYGARAADAKSKRLTQRSKPRPDELAEASPKQVAPSTQPRRVEVLSHPGAAEVKAPPPTPKVAEPSTAKRREEKPPIVVTEIKHAPPSSEVKPAPAPPAPATPKTAESKKTKSGDAGPPPVSSRAPAVLPKAAAPTSRGDRTLTRILGLKIGRIVLDPGHGGNDTGTIGAGGLMEKDLVLEVAKDLRKLLQEKLGAEVVLTRANDTFISLEERTAIANQHQADLFLSIHANSSNIQSLSGVETYFLDFARSASEREVAARENATTVQNVRDLQNLIKKIAQADKSAESRELAAMIQKKLYVGIQKLFPTARNRGVRSAPFVVLIGANMPSVLAEVAFISNPRDEKLLVKGDSRERLAKALFAGIEGYMKTLGSDIAQNHPGSN